MNDDERRARTVRDGIPDRLARKLIEAQVLEEHQIKRSTLHGRTSLTTRELKVVECLSHGLTLGMCADVLGKSLDTVQNQASSARAALNAKTTTHLVAKAIRQGLIP